ncbi:MAG TPA: type I restriction enzyme HsdR N-terminal domain-containing protein [Chitinophagaceae bacterium]|nr:type I restriction enzyme HsdR N-terminal domain-containing protein [Chitinophagaceae bacterium]
MISIDYPAPQFRIRASNSTEQIFDSLRKRWLLLTPEEWVRQNFVQYLIRVMKYPATLISLEKKIRLGELTKRFDILVYDPLYQPWMIIECKSASIPLSQDVLEQALRYNLSVPARYIVISNGDFTFGWRRGTRLEELTELPAFG